MITIGNPVPRKAMHHRLGGMLVVVIVLALVLLRDIEIWLYAGLHLGAAADLETAVYFSTMIYATR